MTYSLTEMAVLAFTIGLTGALAPGPTLVATINSSLRGGWIMGPKVVIGHALVELIIFILIIGGLSVAMVGHSSLIAVVGGIALIIFGILTLLSSRKATMTRSEDEMIANPYLAGILTSIANPYFWVWWLSVGSAMVLEGLRSGILLASIFLVGHWSADFGWYTLVSASLDRGRSILSEANYQKVLALCGVFLILFGAYYLTSL
jgi:threonine/homoserine/homoserine lactone efflux protein